jgi:hypothetical protein
MNQPKSIGLAPEQLARFAEVQLHTLACLIHAP